MDNVTERLRRNIEEQLGGGDVRATSLATTLLAQSISFVHELCNYITITLAELKSSGFSSQDNWYLMSKLLFRTDYLGLKLSQAVLVRSMKRMLGSRANSLRKHMQFTQN